MTGHRTSRGTALATAFLFALALPATAQDGGAAPEPAQERPAPRHRDREHAAPVRKVAPKATPAKTGTEAKPADPKAADPKAAEGKPAITVPLPTQAEMQPIQHARNNGISTCLGAVASASAALVDAPHKAHSFWVQADPDGHVFQSIVGLDYRTRAAPNGMAIISSTPTPGRTCDTTTVQVYPTARPCAQVRSDLLRDGSLTDELSGMPLIHSPSNFEHMLLAAPGNGCVIVAIGLGIGQPRPQAATPAAQPAPGQPSVTAPAPVQAPAPGSPTR